MTLLILAGPAGVGKGSIVSRMIEKDSSFTVSISATTRSPRPTEIEGQHYHFISKAEFEDLIAKDQLLEYALVHGDNYYGTLRSELSRAEQNGKKLIVEIDLQGARQVKRHSPQALSIFVNPPSWDELERRLRMRATETEEQIQTRLNTARQELDAAGEFDYQVTNLNLDDCVDEIIELVRKEDRK